MVNYDYLRPLKALEVKDWYESPFEQRTDLQVQVLENAVILPQKRFPSDHLLFGRGGLADSEGNFVPESGIPGRLEGTYPYTSGEVKNKTVVYCGYLVPQWGHFLVEGASRLWYFLKDDPAVDQYVFFLEKGSKRQVGGNYREFLQLLGIWDKVEIITEPTRYARVILPERGFKMGQYWTEDYKNIFQAVAAHVPPEEHPAERLFLSRSQLSGSGKTEFNMDMLDDFFGRNGYRILFPEKVSLSALIAAIRGADIVALISGSAHHNILFAADGTKNLVLEKEAVTVDFVRDITRMKKFDTALIDANLMIYPVNIGHGPFIMAYRGMLEQYARDHGMVPPDPAFEDKERMRKILRLYCKSYHRIYLRRSYMTDWEVRLFRLAMWESVHDGKAVFDEFLGDVLPVRPVHLFPGWLKKTLFGS